MPEVRLDSARPGTANSRTQAGAFVCQSRLCPRRALAPEPALLAEYGIPVSVIAVVLIGAVLVLGGNLSTMFGSSAHKV